MLLADEQVDDLFNAANNETLWALTDHLNTVRDLVDDNANVRMHREFDSFGQIIASTHYDTNGVAVNEGDPGYVTTDIGYTGKKLDDHTGLANHNERWYEATTGSWTKLDIIWDGTNRYAYVGNQPTTYVDPTGLEGEWFDEIGGQPIVPIAPGEEPLLIQGGGLAIPRYGGYEYMVLGPDGSIQMLTGESYRPIALRQQMLRQEGNELELECQLLDALNDPQTQLDIIGTVPVIGEVADGINGTIYLVRGDMAAAGLSFVAMVPVAGDLIGKGGKIIRRVGDDIPRRRVPWQYGDTGGDLGTTNKYGDITIRPGLTGDLLETTVRHESVHRFLSPRRGPFRELRANILECGYRNSHFLRYTEEAIAETYATRSLRRGLNFPLDGYGISVPRAIAEAGGTVVVIGGITYIVYQSADAVYGPGD